MGAVLREECKWERGCRCSPPAVEWETAKAAECVHLGDCRFTGIVQQCTTVGQLCVDEDILENRVSASDDAAGRVLRGFLLPLPLHYGGFVEVEALLDHVLLHEETPALAFVLNRDEFTPVASSLLKLLLRRGRGGALEVGPRRVNRQALRRWPVSITKKGVGGDYDGTVTSLA